MFPSVFNLRACSVSHIRDNFINIRGSLGDTNSPHLFNKVVKEDLGGIGQILRLVIFQITLKMLCFIDPCPLGVDLHVQFFVSQQVQG